VQGPLPENAFIQQQALSQPPIQPSTATKIGDVHRKREVIAIARLRAAAERREIADQAKFDAAIAKLKEEEEKIRMSNEKKKEELLARKQAAEEKKKAAIEAKGIVAEEKKKASEEKKKKALEEKLAMADKRREAMELRKKQTEEAKRVKAEEKQRIAEEKRRLCKTRYDAEEALFFINQADEIDRQQSFMQTQEVARHRAWEQRTVQQEATRLQAEILYKDKRETEQARSAMVEEERMNACLSKKATLKRTGGASSSQNMRGFKKPRKVNMFDELRGG